MTKAIDTTKKKRATQQTKYKRAASILKKYGNTPLKTHVGYKKPMKKKK